MSSNICAITAPVGTTVHRNAASAVWKRSQKVPRRAEHADAAAAVGNDDFVEAASARDCQRVAQDASAKVADVLPSCSEHENLAGNNDEDEVVVRYKAQRLRTFVPSGLDDADTSLERAATAAKHFHRAFVELGNSDMLVGARDARGVMKGLVFVKQGAAQVKTQRQDTNAMSLEVRHIHKVIARHPQAPGPPDMQHTVVECGESVQDHAVRDANHL